MKLKLTLITILVLGSFFLRAQNQLVIELTTDKYASETSWTIRDVFTNIITQRDNLENRTTYLDTLTIAEGACYYWTIYDQYSDGMSAGEGGDFKIHLDGEVVATCENPNFGDSLTVYSLGANCSPNDVMLYAINTLTYQSKDSVSLTFEILNMGSETLTHLEYSYQMNEDTFGPFVQEDLQIEPGQLTTIVVPQKHLFTLAGDYEFTIEISKANQKADAFADNNSATKSLTVVDGFVKKNMVEIFNSSWNSSQYGSYKNFVNTLKQWEGTYSLVSYMVYEEYDKHWFPEVTLLKQFYQATGLPNFRINFPRIMLDNNFQESYEQMLGVATPLKIGIEAFGKGDSVKIKASIFASENLEGTYTFRGVLTEKECTDIGTDNLEYSPYYNVVLAMVNAFNDFTIEGFTAGETLEFTYTLPYTDFYLENTQSLNEMSMAFYVQDDITRDVLQSEQVAFSYTSIAPELSYSIANGAQDVDTTELVFTSASNRILYNLQAGSHFNPEEHVVCMAGEAKDIPVPMEVSINEEHTQFSLKPKYGWEETTQYHIHFINLRTVDGVEVLSDTISFTTYQYVSAQQTSVQNIKVFPNPACNEVFIQMPEAGTLNVHSADGKQVFSASEIKGEFALSIKDWEAGVYFFQLEIQGIKTVQKIVKQ